MPVFDGRDFADRPPENQFFRLFVDPFDIPGSVQHVGRIADLGDRGGDDHFRTSHRCEARPRHSLHSLVLQEKALHDHIETMTFGLEALDRVEAIEHGRQEVGAFPVAAGRGPVAAELRLWNESPTDVVMQADAGQPGPQADFFNRKSLRRRIGELDHSFSYDASLTRTQNSPAIRRASMNWSDSTGLRIYPSAPNS